MGKRDKAGKTKKTAPESPPPSPPQEQSEALARLERLRAEAAAEDAFLPPTKPHSLTPHEFSLKEHTQANPTDIAAWSKLGDSLHRAKRLDEAAEAFIQGTKSNPSWVIWVASCYNSLGTVYADKHDFQKAREAHKKAIALNPMKSDYVIDLGDVLCELHDLDGSEKAYLQAIDLNSSTDSTAAAWNQLGVLRNQRKRYEGAHAAFGHAAELDPGNQLFRNNVAQCLANMGKKKEADKHFVEALTIANASKEETAKSWNHIGNERYDSKQWKRARDAYHQATVLDPTQPLFFTNLGATLKLLGDRIAAKKAFLQATTASPSNVKESGKGWYGLGEVHHESGDLASASAAFQRSTEIDPSNFDPWHSLGEVAVRMKNYQQAQTAFEQAMQLNHTHMCNVCQLALQIHLIHHRNPTAAEAVLREAASFESNEARESALLKAALVIRTQGASTQMEQINNAVLDILNPFFDNQHATTITPGLLNFKSPPARRTCSARGCGAVEGQKKGDAVVKLKVCSQCKKKLYCSRECSVKDWKERHKQECKTQPKSEDRSRGMCECPGCSSIGGLKPCSVCKQVWYCSKECQKKDWAVHRKECET